MSENIDVAARRMESRSRRVYQRAREFGHWHDEHRALQDKTYNQIQSILMAVLEELDSSSSTCQCGPHP